MANREISEKWLNLPDDDRSMLAIFLRHKIAKKLPLDVLILRHGFSSFKLRLKDSMQLESMQTGVLVGLMLVNLLVMLALLLYYTCSSRTERSCERPPCTCAIEATHESVGLRKLRSKLRSIDNPYLRFSNVPTAGNKM